MRLWFALALLALAAALVAGACAPAPGPDERVGVAQGVVARFHQLYNDDVGSVVAEVMTSDDSGTIEWGNYLRTQRQRFGRVQETQPVGYELVPLGGDDVSVELRYASRFDFGHARELIVVRVEGSTAKVRFYATWSP